MANEYKVEIDYIEHMQMLGWKFVELKNYEDVKANFRKQLCKFNADKLIAVKGVAELSDAEFRRLILQVENFDVITAAEHWKNNNAIMIDLDNEKYVYLQLSSPDVKKNIYQISHQIRMEKSASPVVKNNNRYDVTLLINGLPILQTELKRPGVDFTEAINQINRYRRDSFGCLFNFLQLFVVSNETATKYFSNQNRNQNGQFNKIQASMVFFWLMKTNERVVKLSEFANAVLTPERLTDILYNYMIIKKEEKQLIVMRPYQIYEVEAAVKRVVEENSNGFITACTGSGKTLTSFKTAQILRDITQIKKVIHLLDRIDLDDQTVAEFNSFEAGCVDYTDNSNKLLKKLDSNSIDDKLIITTIQKLNNVLKSNNKRAQEIVSKLENENIVFTIDECHRSQAGKMHPLIKQKFKNAKFIGFTGTPIFEENAGNKGQTTADIFEAAQGLNAYLHQYMMKDAIADNNVLPFQVEYIRTIFGNVASLDSAMLDDPDYCYANGVNINQRYHDKTRMRKILMHIFKHHRAKRQPQGRLGSDIYTSLFAVESIKDAVNYYNMALKINAGLPEEERLTFATIFSAQDNKDEDDECGTEALEKCMREYNKTFGTGFNKDTFDAYRKDISKRMKQLGDKQIDILIVVNMFLTGFDAKPLNTLYLDKDLQWHGLIQAYSRTNRVYKKTKTCGNIVTYRNLKKRQDEALALFSGNGDPNACIRGNYEDYLRDWTRYVNTLRSIAKTPYDAAKIVSESVKKAFVEAFRNVMRTLKQMELFTIFKWSDLAKDLTCDEYEAYEGVYKNIRNSAKWTDEPEGYGLADIDFETELIGTDTVNFDYIMGLLTVIRSVQPVSKRMEMLDKLLTDYEDGDDKVLRIQKELLKKFVTERLNDLPEGLDEDEMRSAFYAYKKGLEKEEVKGFALDVGVEERVIEGILAECVRSGEALMSACCGIKDYVKGGFGKKRSAVKSMVTLAQKYAV